jgi:hypothetical protein
MMCWGVWYTGNVDYEKILGQPLLIREKGVNQVSFFLFLQLLQPDYKKRLNTSH